MAMKITPGWDFGVNDVPTAEKLNQMAAGMKIENIPLSQLAGDLISLHTTNGSGVSLGEGGLWVNDLGELMVNTRFGRLAVVRANGGWETRRYNIRHDGTNLPVFGSIGNPFTGRYVVHNRPTSSQNEASDVYFIYDRDPAAGLVLSAVNIDTAPSGGNARMCMRGGVFWTPQYSARSGTVMQYGTKDNVNGSDLVTPVSRIPTLTLTTQDPVFGLFTRNVGTDDLSFGWIYGLVIARH